MFQPVKFGRYLLVDRIAMGGMAEIFLSKLLGIEGFEKAVAIKRILPHWSHNSDFIKMLIDEAKIVVQLNHPNVVQVYELGKEGETYYIAMEYVEGIDLRRLRTQLEAQQKTLPLELTLYIIEGLLKGLAYAHRLEIIHRDISPQNLLLSYNGEVKITDFGIAKAANKTHETATGALKGKFAYMSPEQANQDPIDNRSDLFSAGILLYELTSGERLFKGKTDIETLEQVRQAKVSYPEALFQKLPKRLEEILRKALVKDPAVRYQSALEFAEAVQGLREEVGKHTSQEDLSRFLKKLFLEERQVEGRSQTQLNTATRTVKTVVETQLLQTEQIVARSSFPKLGALRLREKWPLRWWGGLAMLLLLVLGLTWAGAKDRRERSSLPTPPPSPEGSYFEPVLEEKATALASPQTAEAGQVLSEGEVPRGAVLPPSKIEPGFGFLSVQAAPWGAVYLDGEKKRWESPLQRQRMESGTHQVRVYYEPQKAWLSGQALVLKEQHTRCVANFQEKEQALKCDFVQ